jgi:hypothetical protein
VKCSAASFEVQNEKIVVLSEKHFDLKHLFLIALLWNKKPLEIFVKQELFPRRWFCVYVTSRLCMKVKHPPSMMVGKANKVWLGREKLFKVNSAFAWINLKAIMSLNGAYFEWVWKVWKDWSLHRVCLLTRKHELWDFSTLKRLN